MEFLTFWQQLPTVDRQSLAAAVDSKPIYLSQIAYGHRKPSGKLAQRIERATEGRVTLSDLRPDLWPAPQQVAA